MKMYLNTAGEVCELRLNKEVYFFEDKMHLAEKIFSFIEEKLTDCGANWQDITEVEFFTGPGSFTGLRIGAAVVNAVADCLGIPILDQNGRQHKIVLPDYGRPARISTPRK